MSLHCRIGISKWVKIEESIIFQINSLRIRTNTMKAINIFICSLPLKPNDFYPCCTFLLSVSSNSFCAIYIKNHIEYLHNDNMYIFIHTLLKRFFLISVIFLVIMAVTTYEFITKILGSLVVKRAKYPFMICKKNVKDKKFKCCYTYMHKLYTNTSNIRLKMYMLTANYNLQIQKRLKGFSF